MTNPKRGEVWLVQLDPTRGQEIQKTRPAVVISADILGAIPMRITSWFNYLY
jgi:mRNA interferase MazF